MRGLPKQLLFLASLSISLIVSSLLSQKSMAADGLPQEGIYSGSIMVNGNPIPVPLDVSVSFTEQTTTTDPDQIGAYTKVLLGQFVLDHEGGPYGFTSITYDLETGILDMRYVRPTLASSGLTSFRLLGHLNADGSISGNAQSADSSVSGTFSMKFIKKDAQVAVQDTIVGVYTGTLTYLPSKKTDPIEIDLEDIGSANTTNPQGMALDFTPGRVGSAKILGDNPLPLAFSQVVIDYLKGTITMTNSTSGSVVSGGGVTSTTSVTSTGSNLSFIGKVSADSNTISGVVNSSLKGKTGTFTVTRTNQ